MTMMIRDRARCVYEDKVAEENDLMMKIEDKGEMTVITRRRA